MRSTRSPYVVAVGLVAVTTAIGGCTGTNNSSTSSSASGSGGSGSGAASASASATKAPDAALAKFYSQKLDWTDCGNVKCAPLTVPVDYANPGGQTIQITVDKVEASGTRKGSLVVNPGGPGGSGYDYAAAADYIVSNAVRKNYDIVGFDPRGVQRSEPITCVDDAGLDAYLGADPTPDDKAEENAAKQTASGFADACKAKAGPLLGHVSTVEVAKDMDILRAAIGDTKLNYLGKSYGTFIGSTYADLFPTKVGRMVLDGVVPPDLSVSQINEGQAKGFEQATQAYVRECIQDSSCPLGTTEAAGMAKIRAFLKQVDANPLPVQGDARVTKLTEGWASMGIADAMYSKDSWPRLTSAFKAAFAGNGTELMSLADEYAERNSDGSYSGNIMQVINAVNCLDRQGDPNLSSYESDATAFSKVAPTWGPMLAWGSLVCGEWPIKATGAPKKITADGSGPIVVVSTTRDPATPYDWGVRLAKELKNGHLISYDGDGHTAYHTGSTCVDDSVDAYLLDGTVPPANKAC